MKTNNLKSLMILMLAGTLIVLFSCGEESVTPVINHCQNWSEEIQDELNAFNAALQAYAADPNSTKCNAFKNAAMNYVDALEEILECDGITNQQKNQIKNNIDQARDAVAEMNCAA